jgi:predicted DNA-binding transcriptional regulator YafY
MDMEKAGRLLKLLGLLETRRDWTAAELSRRLGVTTRTVRRDVDALRELGYPVNAVSGPGGGYQLGSGGSIPPLMLEEDEAVALAAALRMASREQLLGIDEAGISLMAKIEQMLPPKLRARLDDVMETTVASSGLPAPRFDPATLSVLARAARNDERVRFIYRAPDRDPVERHVEPYRVVIAARMWYLVAFDRDRREWRTFRLDRMEAPYATGMRFKRVDPPDPVAHVEEGMSLRVYSVQAVVRLGADIERARRFVPGTIGRLTAIDEHTTRLDIGADEPAWIAHYLASLWLPFEVLEPPSVRTAVVELGRRLVTDHA